jgi:hypothetical protein
MLILLYLWLYIMHIPQISRYFNYKILTMDQHCSQTLPTAFPQCPTPSVTPTFMKILHKHTRVYISTAMFTESMKQSKTFQSCS